MSQTHSDWVECPVCKNPDTRKTTDEEGNTLYNCTNHACLSNGGKYINPLVLEELIRERQYQIDLDTFD